jgi:hemerythrin-like domain-containing protein
MHEHEAVLLALELMERIVHAVSESKEGAEEDLAQLLDFFRGFVDHCHHGKEELALFPELERLGVPREGGPVGIMLSEHEIGRGHVRRLVALLEASRRGEGQARGQVMAEARAYRELLEAHIQKENRVLFPMADRLIPADRASELVQEFDRIELEHVGEGKHEAYHRMLHDLRERYGSGS